MFNFIMLIISIIICFGSIILIDKLFKKDGLIVWISVASVLANILVCKTVNILGFVSSLGNVIFASTFLVANIIREKYNSKDDSAKAVKLGLVSTIGFIIATQIALIYKPDISDIAHESMTNLFTLSLRTSIASVTMYFLSNMLNIYLFDKLKNMIPGKLWFRNIISTIISNCSENFLFAFAAFIGIFDIGTILSIALVGTLIEIFITICSTPFIYITERQ